ncbi:MAG: hypothetical protein AABY74_00780 [Planctomycetota bacterium]
MVKLQIQSDAKDSVLDIIRAAISAEIKRLEIGLDKADKYIKEFETEYNVSSDTFQKEFTAEDMKKEDLEYIAWAGELKIREKTTTDSMGGFFPPLPTP